MDQPTGKYDGASSMVVRSIFWSARMARFPPSYGTSMINESPRTASSAVGGNMIEVKGDQRSHLAAYAGVALAGQVEAMI
jgi:hypothetical protein